MAEISFGENEITTSDPVDTLPPSTRNTEEESEGNQHPSNSNLTLGSLLTQILGSDSRIELGISGQQVDQLLNQSWADICDPN